MKKKILVLCTGNSCRSQMLHGFLKQKPGLEVYSAGVETHGLNRKAVQVMAEAGVDISDHTSNHVDEYRDILFDAVITVCDHAAERCPVFPGKTQRIHSDFPDPAKAQGEPDEVLKAFRAVRDAIREFAEEFSL